MTTISRILSIFTTTLAMGACNNGAMSSAGVTGNSVTGAPALSSLTPAAGTTGVDPTKPITITFTLPMMNGMEMLVVVHEGSVTGPQIGGTSVWSTDRATLTFTPATPLKAKTNYIVHFSPNLQGTNGKTINMGAGTMMGGPVVTGGMMGSLGGMMNGQWGPGMMGAGWQASDGTFGMTFTFTTA